VEDSASGKIPEPSPQTFKEISAGQLDGHKSSSPALPPALQQVSSADASWWSSVKEDIRASEYQISWQEHTVLADIPRAYQAPNRANNLRTYFTEQGTRVIPRVFEGEVPPWEWGLTLSSYGSPAGEKNVTAVSPRVEKNRVEYRHGTLDEWYVNNQQGLKSGFTLHAPPVPDPGLGSTITINLNVNGDWDPSLTANGGAVEFTQPGDETVILRSGDLLVRDALGRHLPARFELPEPDLVRIELETVTATYPLTVDLLTTTPFWSAESDQAQARFGISVAGAGDVNGDDYPDIIVGASYYDNGYSNQGRVFVYHNSGTGLYPGPGWTADIDQHDAAFGCSVGPAGDVNNDGYSDVIIGARGYENGQTGEGGAFVYHGSESSLSDTPDWVVEGDQEYAKLGYSVSTAGDVNNDDYSDVIVGAISYHNGENGEGGAFVYHGSDSGLSTSADWTAEGDQVNAEFGTSVGTAGDVNDDGYSDVIVGADWHENDLMAEGRAYVYHGSGSGLSSSANWMVEGDQEYARLGSAVGTAGDVNGDGYSDVVVGADGDETSGNEEERAFLYHGSGTGLSPTANAVLEGDQPDAKFGSAVGTAGDVNGDGYSDVVVGAPDYDNGQTNEGGVFLYYGSESGLATNAVWSAESDQDHAQFGNSVGTAGDVDHDGYSDLIVGAYGYENDQQGEGGAFVYDLVPDFDLMVSKSNDTSGAGTVGTTFHWTITVSNISEQEALFTDGSTILKDDLAADATYGPPVTQNFTQVTNSGNIACEIASQTLTCTADGADVTLGASPGAFEVTFPVTPSAAGDLVNPAEGGVCQVDPDDTLAEDNESNNHCSDHVTVNPDLTVTKTNDTDGTSSVEIPFTWILTVTNIGNTPATFNDGQSILKDELSPDAAYGTPAVQNEIDVTNGGNIACSLESYTLTCAADGADVTLAAGTGAFEVAFEVTPNTVGDLVNPESGGVCQVDPDGHLAEYDETNNDCADTVTVAAPDPVLGQLLTVANTSEEVNGDVSSPSALIADPGPDGISLPEAITAAENTTTYETIEFDPTLTGSVITLTGGLPVIQQGNLTIDGDIDNDRQPDITVDGTNASAGTGIRVQGGSRLVVRGLAIQNWSKSGIEVVPDGASETPVLEDLVFQFNNISSVGHNAIDLLIWNQSQATIKNVEIVSNTLGNFQNGISIAAGIGENASDNEISGVSIIDNIIDGNDTAIGISPSASSGLSRNTVSEIEIRGNQISEHTSSTILMDVANQADCNDNLMDDIVIAENSIGGLVEFVSVGESGSNATGNTLSNVSITDNVFPGGSIMFGGATGNMAHDNLISGVMIDRNHISGCPNNGVYLVSGSGGAYNNLFEDVTIRNTFVGNCNDAGILLHGFDSPSHDNALTHVDIVNVTLVENGNPEWAGGLNINTKNSSNTITDVTLSSAILSGNEGNNSIRGSLVPDLVQYTILRDRRFTGENGNGYVDPQFVDPEAGDYTLQPGSPAVDTGDPAAANAGLEDLDQKVRVWDGSGDGSEIIDRGAWEYGASAAQEIAVKGNWRSILAGDKVPSVLDGTDFGMSPVNGDSRTKTYTIQNTGDLDLEIQLPITITGAAADDFSVRDAPETLIPAGGSTTFSVDFVPGGPGVREAALSVANNDSDEDPFTFAVQGWGLSPDTVPPADFNGDGATDVSVYRPSNGNWYIKGMEYVSWGRTGDLPVPGDYNADSTTDLAVFRPSNGKWYIKDQGNVRWGRENDVPMPCDYDGDGQTDLAVYRPSNGNWYIKDQGYVSWGRDGDIPVPGDYDQDGTCDMAVYRPSNGKWYIKDIGTFSWGMDGDIPVPGDYNGDGATDIAVYRPSNGNWYIKDQGFQSWGNAGDIPVPGDYDQDGAFEIAVLCPSNGNWYIQGMDSVRWYFAGDYPLPVRDTDADGEPHHTP
jgi:hypothetical protein